MARPRVSRHSGWSGVVGHWLAQDEALPTKWGSLRYVGPRLYAGKCLIAVRHEQAPAGASPMLFVAAARIKGCNTASTTSWLIGQFHPSVWRVPQFPQHLVEVADPMCEDHERNLSDLVSRIQTRAQKALNAIRHVDGYAGDVRELQEQLEFYCHAWGLPIPEALTPEKRERLTVKLVTRKLEGANG